MSMFRPEQTARLRNRVQLQQISVADARYMLEQFHYLHRARAGRQVNYAVLIDGIVDGVITYAYPMMSADLCGVPADELVEFARLYLHQNIPHTATCAIGKSIKRLVPDWERMFPDAKPLRLIVSWSDKEYHKGTIYKAANFLWLRVSRGDHRKAARNNADTKRGFRRQTSDYAHDKDCWVYPITPEARDLVLNDIGVLV